MITEEAWVAAVALVAAAPELDLACHVNPDGDALGSMLAVGLAARAQGKVVRCSYAEPDTVPAVFSFLPGLDLLVPAKQMSEAPAVFLAFDTGALDRLGLLARSAVHATTSVVLDHHATNDGFASVDLLDANAAATAVVARELLARLGWPLDRDIATCLYTALVTDTGRFQYANTSPSVHELAAELLSFDIEQDRISQRIYDTRTLAALKVDAIALERLTVVPDARLAWTAITQDDLTRAGATEDDLDRLIDTIRVVEDTDVALLLKQRADGAWKLSMRSRGDSDVGAIAASFGGGGHRLAAGCTAPKEMTDPAAIAEQVAGALRA